MPELERAHYQLDVDATTAKASLDAFAREITKSLDAREAVMGKLLTEEPWDLFIGVITETDRMHHSLWSALEDRAHPHHQFFLDVYRRIDRWLGRVYEWYGNRGLFMLMSDHGFCRITREVYINYWLKTEGYLRFTSDSPASPADIAGPTTAFALDPARISIHTRNRYPRGSVASAEEYDRLRNELRDRPAGLTIEGARVIKRVFFKEELYDGAALPGAPDLVLLPEWGYDLKGALNRPALTGTTLLSGMHTQDDATCVLNTPSLAKSPVHITDLAPTALKYLGVPSLAPMDGTALT